MSAPGPRANPDLLGHAAAEATFLDAARRGRLHHAWLITGPFGIGKATLAYRLGRRLLARLPAEGQGAALDPSNPTFRRVASGGHADLQTVTLTADPRTGHVHREILVDGVRAGAAFLHRTAIEGGWRVLIVDPAEALNTNAANALLKVVEEPPERALLVLVCACPGRLPATLRSRCRVLRLAPLDEHDMETLLARYLDDVSADVRARLAALAEGSPGRALRLAAKDGAAIAGLVSETL
ncbi:MAG: DNA polymerase III subunit delta', partial [Acetobacteraceae bacterium]